MPIVIPKDIPAYDILDQENIFVMSNTRALSQDIRPIEILILNLMPTKIETETQILRLLANSPLQINPTFMNTESYKSKHISQEHLERFYKTFSEIKNNYYDGMIITGAPVEKMEYDDVLYWKELEEIFNFSKTHVTSTLFICWGAQAGLKYFYGLDKKPLDKKLFGVFKHRKCIKFEQLLNGIDDVFYIPHSRHTKIDDEDILKCKDLIPLAKSDEAGISIIKSKDNSQIFITGHMEYDKFTLKNEYERDLAKGLPINRPDNYFTDETNTDVDVLWRSTANIFFTNWLNYYVYQVTPYDFKNK